MARKEVVRERIKKRRNYFPTLVVIALLWIFLGIMVFFIDPLTFGAVPLLFVNLFLALLFTFSTIFANTERGVIGATAVVFFLLLRFFGLGNVVNLVLLAGLAVALDYYLKR